MIEKTALGGVYIISPKVYGDNRGWFSETYSKDALAKLGIDCNFVQDNHSYSAKSGTLRGLHFQNRPYAQAKLVRCIKGSILDVAVDIRKGSPTYLKYTSVVLSAQNKKQLFIPKGFAHGFLTLEDDTEVEYKVDAPYSAAHDQSIRFDDAEIGVNWNISHPILSDKDKNAPPLHLCNCSFSKKVLITGANGLLGGELIKKLKSENYLYSGTDIGSLDITDARAVNEFVSGYKPDYILHCAAYTAVDKAQDDSDNCMRVNYNGTLNLAKAASSSGCTFVYISTDYVFDGGGDAPYKETDAASPLSVYGNSKLMGERAVIENLEKYFIFRTSWVFGGAGDFVHTMLKLADSNNRIRVVGDQVGSPTYAKDLAHFIIAALDSTAYGTYHVTNEGFCSRHAFASEIFARAGKEPDVIKITSAEYPTRAPRPLNSRLSKNKLQENGFKRLPAWQNALTRYLEGFCGVIK